VESATLCPLDCIQTEIVAPLRIGARIHEDSNQICATEDDGEDEGSLTAVRSFVNVGAPSQQSGHGVFITGSNGVG
jgi:hypothetical protein